MICVPLVLQENRVIWQRIQHCLHQYKKNVEILAYFTSKLIKDLLQGPLDLIDIVFTIHIQQLTHIISYFSLFHSGKQFVVVWNLKGQELSCVN